MNTLKADPVDRIPELLTGRPCLVVTSSPQLGDRLARDLASLRCQHREVPDGFSALRELRDAADQGKAYAWVFVDSTLPGVKPRILASMIRQDPHLAGAKMVVVRPPEDQRPEEELGMQGLGRVIPLWSQPSELEGALDRPQAPPRATVRPVPAPAPTPQKRISRRILVADDMASNRKLMEILLRQRGHQVTGAEDGRQALELLQTESFDLVFMDCNMPFLDGLEATREVRRRGYRALDRELPIIALTAASDEDDRERCREAGMNGFLPKPFQGSELDDVLGHWLSLGGPTDS